MRFSSQCRQKRDRNELPNRSSNVKLPLIGKNADPASLAGAHVTLVRLKRHGRDNRGQRVSSGRSGAGSRNWVSSELAGLYGVRDPVGSKIDLTIGGRKYWKLVAAGNGYLSSDSRRLGFGLGSAWRTNTFS